MKTYDVICKCGHKFIVSHTVIGKLLNCPECLLSIRYDRDLSGKVRTTIKVGKFKDSEELERRLYETAQDALGTGRSGSGPAPSKDKEPSRVPGIEDSNPHKINGPANEGGPVLNPPKGVSKPAGRPHKPSGEAKKARVAK
jgi:hypothetical protein